MPQLPPHAPNRQERQRYISNLIEREHIHSRNEIMQAFKRDFQGYRPDERTLDDDLKTLAVILVPQPEGPKRYRMPQIALPIHIEQELAERMRVDGITVDRNKEHLLIRTNKSIARNVAELIKMLRDEDARPGIWMVTHDGDDEIYVICESPGAASNLQQLLRSMI